MAKGDFVGEFELYVLLALVHLRDEAYGVSIRREIESRTGREIAIGAIYATLARLEDKRLVRFRVSDPQPIQGGRSRKYFTLTASGVRALRHSTTMLERMMAGWSPAIEPAIKDAP
jgi:DNA-binding PadR family transcriptional regulator